MSVVSVRPGGAARPRPRLRTCGYGFRSRDRRRTARHPASRTASARTTSSLNGYAPLADYWAAHGFVVIQPTHLDSRTLSLPARRPRCAADLALTGRGHDARPRPARRHRGRRPAARRAPRPEQVAVAGHSMGGHTASLLLGARLTDPATERGEPDRPADQGGRTARRDRPRRRRPHAVRGRELSVLHDHGLLADDHARRSSSPATRTPPRLTVRARTGTPTRTSSARARSPCSPCSARSTGSAASPDTTSPRPRTRAPPGSPRSSGSPRPTSAGALPRGHRLADGARRIGGRRRPARPDRVQVTR